MCFLSKFGQIPKQKCTIFADVQLEYRQKFKTLSSDIVSDTRDGYQPLPLSTHSVL